jgi:hypothetical protein
VLAPMRRFEEIVTAAITPAVVIVVAVLSPHDALEQPILRAFDTAVGIAVGRAAGWAGPGFTGS